MPMPTLLTRMSRRPSSLVAAWTARLAVSSSRVSPTTTAQRRPAALAASARASSRSSRRATTTRSAPSPRNARAMAAPMPELAPVMMATCPSSVLAMLPSSFRVECSIAAEAIYRAHYCAHTADTGGHYAPRAWETEDQEPGNVPDRPDACDIEPTVLRSIPEQRTMDWSRTEQAGGHGWLRNP